MGEYLIGLDIGSSALKAVLASRTRGVIAVSERGYPMHRPHPGWAENDPEDWVAAAAEAVPELLSRGGITAPDVIAVCIVGQRDIGALIDGDGQPLGACIHWSDRRDEHETHELFDRIGRDRILEISGTPPTPGLLLANLAWVGRHQPAVLARTRAVLAPKDYLAFRLTGEVATDRTTPTRSHLNDWRSEGWSRQLCDEAGIPLEILPEVRYDPWRTRAILDQRAALIGLVPGIVLAAGGGDDPAAALGCGVIEPGELSIGSSSSTSLRIVTERPSVSTGSGLGVLPHVAPGRYLHEMVAMGTGTSLKWFRDLFASLDGAAPHGGLAQNQGTISYDDLLASAEVVEPGATGLLFYPYIEGSTVPYNEPRVRGALLGVGPHHTRGHVTRSIIESIAYQYPPLIEAIEAASHDVRQITISDGEARSQVWNQIKADVMGREMQVSAVAEAPAVGAAILAGMAAGVFDTAQAGIQALSPPRSIVTPSSSAHARYTPLRARWEVARAHLFALTTVLDPDIPA